MRGNRKGRFFLLGLTLALLLPGCKKQDAEPSAAPTDEQADKDEGAVQDEQAGKDSSEAKLKNKMKHCPTSVDGAMTSIEKTDGAVRLIVMHNDAGKLAEIKERAEHLANVAGKAETEIKHTGMGTGGGAKGQCPAGIKDTKVTVKAEEGAVVVSLEPLEGTTVDDVYKLARKRIQGGARGKEHGSGSGKGTGGGGGKGHGDKSGGAGAAAKKEGHQHGSGSGAGMGGGGKGSATGNKDGLSGLAHPDYKHGSGMGPGRGGGGRKGGFNGDKDGKPGKSGEPAKPVEPGQ